MEWWRAATLVLLVYSAAVTAQRGSRRYIPDEASEESVSVDNHKFKSRGRDVTVETQRAEGRRGTTHVSEASSSRQSPAGIRGRGRTEVRQQDEVRQYHSSPGRRQQLAENDESRNEGRQFHSRRNQESERTRFTSREDVESKRIKSRDNIDLTNTKLIRNQNLGRTRSRVDLRESHDSGRTQGTSRLPSRPLGDAESQSATIDTIRNRAGSRGKTSVVRKSSVRSKNKEEPPNHAPNPTPYVQKERTISRSDVGEEEKNPSVDQELAPENKPLRQDLTENLDPQTKISEVQESSQESNPTDLLSTKDIGSNDVPGTSLTETITDDDAKSSLSSITPTLENVIDYSPNLNDVEESNRASRRLDTIATEIPQYTRSRGRIADDSSRRQTPDDARKNRQEALGRLPSRGRNTEIKTRSRTTEEQYDTKSRNGNAFGRASRFETSTKNEGLEDKSQNRNTESRVRSESIRSSRIEALRGRGNVNDLSKSRSTENKAKASVDQGPTRKRISSEESDRNQGFERAKPNPEVQSSSRSINGRSRGPSTESFSTSEVRRRPEKAPFATPERTQELPKKELNGLRSPPRYSAKIPDASQIRDDKKSNSPFRGRATDFANFRARPKTNAENSGFKSYDLPPSSTAAAEIQSDRRSQAKVREHKNEVISSTPSERIEASTVRSLESLLHRRPLANRPRGTAKGPKLEEGHNSEEVRDEDNYPEVYKQLKKSGTSTEEILALLKARKAAQEKVKNSNAKFTQPDASLKSSQQDLKGDNEEIKIPQEKTEHTPRFNFRSRYQDKNNNFNNQRAKSKSFSMNLEDDEIQSARKDNNMKSRQEFRQSKYRTRTEITQRSKLNEKTDEEKSKPTEDSIKERKYTASYKRFDYKSLNRKKSQSTSEPLTPQDSPIASNHDKELEYDSFNEQQEERRNSEENFLDNQQRVDEDKNLKLNPVIDFSFEEPTADGQTEKTKRPYIPRNREKEYERFKARTEKTNEFASVDAPIKPNYKLYNRKDGSTYPRRSFTTPTSEGVDITPSQPRNSFASTRNRPPYVPPKKSFTKQVTTPVPLSRYRARKSSLTKFVNQEDLKVDNSEDHKLTINHELNYDEPGDLRPHINDLSIDSLVSESEHASYTTEPIIAQKAIKKHQRYKESFIQRIPPRGKAFYTRPTFRASTTTEEVTTARPEISTVEEETSNLPDLSDSYESIQMSTSSFVGTDDAFPTAQVTEDDITPSITTSEATTLEMTSPMPTTTSTTTSRPTTTTSRPTTTTTTSRPTTTTTSRPTTITSTSRPTTITTTSRPTTTTKKTTSTHKTTKHTTSKPRTTKPTTKMSTSTTTTTITLPTTSNTPTTIPTTTQYITSTTTVPTTTTTRPTTITTTTHPTTTTTTRPITSTTTHPTTTTTTTRPTTTTTTTRPTTTTTRSTTTTTTHPKTSATTKPPTTTKRKSTTKKTKATTTTRKPTTTTMKQRTAATSSITTRKATETTTQKPSSSSPHTAVPRKTQTSTASPPRSTTFHSIPSTPNFLSTIAYLAKNFTVTPIDYGPVNTADFRTTSKPTESTTAMSNAEHYVVYGLLPNNNVVRKVVKTTKAPIDLPFIIYGLYPNGTIVRRFPNGTIIPDETEEENEVIGSVDPDSHEELEEVVKKDRPLSYLYPPGLERPTPLQSSTTSTEGPTTASSIINTSAPISRTTEKPTSKGTSRPTTKGTVRAPTKETNKATTKETTRPTTKGTISQVTKNTTTKKTTTTTKKPTTQKPTTTTTKTTPHTTTTKQTSATARTTTPTKLSTTIKTTSKPTTRATTKSSTTQKTTSKGTTTTTTQTSKKPPVTGKIHAVKSTVTSNGTKPKTDTTTNKSKQKQSTKATTPLSDIEILSNLLSQGADGRLFTGTTENSDVLANKVIQLAIERAQKSTTQMDGGRNSTLDLQSLSSTAVPIVKEEIGGSDQGEIKNKTGKISVWVIPPDESSTTNSLEVPVSKPDEALLNSLISTPNTLENLSLSDQLLLADVLSSTAFPQTTTKKKKKKKPKTTTTTTTPGPFPVLRYLFGRNRGGGGLFQGGLFRGGGLGLLGAGSSPQVIQQESAGGIFQNEGPTQDNTEFTTEAQVFQENAQEGTRLVNAAINVSRAVSQFMGFVIQGAAQSFQNYLQTRTRALAEALAYPPPSN